MSREGRTPENPAKLSPEEHKAALAAMSPTSKRRYREHLSYVVLSQPVKCPERKANHDNFDGKHFAFFIEDGWFCIEHRKSGEVIEIPPSAVRGAYRKVEAQT